MDSETRKKIKDKFSFLEVGEKNEEEKKNKRSLVIN
jgi:hypothetical protein